MMIVLSFNSLLVISIEGMVPDIARGLVSPDIVLQGEGQERGVVVRCKKTGD